MNQRRSFFKKKVHYKQKEQQADKQKINCIKTFIFFFSQKVKINKLLGGKKVFQNTCQELPTKECKKNKFCILKNKMMQQPEGQALKTFTLKNGVACAQPGTKENDKEAHKYPIIH